MAPVSDTADRLYFRQLLSGRDFGSGDMVARQMVNFVYLIGDRETGEAVVVDPAYDVAAILEHLEADGMRCTGVLATHHHPDHHYRRRHYHRHRLIKTPVFLCPH